MEKTLIIDYYTDVLCVWAWIAQKRIDELKLQWGDQIEFKFHYLNLFANTEKRIGEGWKTKGGFKGFSKHVQEAAQPYPDAIVNNKIWHEVRPKSSLNAHMLLKAIDLTEGSIAAEKCSVTLRQQFFELNKDIGNMKTLLALIEQHSIAIDPLKRALSNGEAAAALASDYQKAQELGVKGSPSWIMNNGRQTLYGNVGFRVLNANIKEYLENNQHEASWC